MGIRRHLWTLILPVALFAASGIPGLAKDSRTVALTHDTVLNGTTLPAGRYLVQWKAHSPLRQWNSRMAAKLFSRRNADSRTVARNTPPVRFSTILPQTAP